MTSKIIVNTIEADTGISSVTFASNINLQNDSSILVSSSGVRLGTGSTIAAPSANEITLSTNSAERLRIKSDGNVGVGDDNPDVPFNVKAGGASFAGQTTHAKIEDTTSLAANVGGLLALEGVYNGSGDPAAFAMIHGGKENATDGNYAGYLRFLTRPSNALPQERLRIDSSGRLLLACTTPPNSGVNAGLQIQHTSTANITLARNDSSITDGNSLGRIDFYGNDGGTFEHCATIAAQADGAHAAGDKPMRLIFGTSADGAASPTERLRIDSSGRVMIGTQTVGPTAGEQLTIADSANAGITIRSGTTAAGTILFEDDTADRGEIQYSHNGDYMRFKTAGTERLRITDGGMLGINMTPSTVGSSTYMLQIYNAGSQCFMSLGEGSGGNGPLNGLVIGVSNAAHYITGRENRPMIFATNDTERMRLSSIGELMVYGNATVSALRTAASSSGSSEILYCSRNSSSTTVGTGVYAIYSNGTASSLSDRTQKKNIETTRDGYLEDLNRLRVVKYNWNDQEDGTPKELGLIAQEVEEVFPGLISNMRSDVGIGTTASTKGVKTSVLPYMLLKALQEANAEIVALKARVNTLEGS